MPITVSRLLPSGLPITLACLPGQPLQGRITLSSGHSLFFNSQSSLPISLSSATIDLIATGRITLDWTTRLLSILPIGRGGGCNQSSSDEIGNSRFGLSPPTAQERQHSVPSTHTDLLSIYASDGDFEAMFDELLVESNFNIAYFEESLRYIALNEDANVHRIKAAIRFLKRCFFMVFLTITKSGKYVQRELSDRCRSIIAFMIRNMSLLTTLQIQTLSLIQSGLYWISHSTLVPNTEIMQGLEAAYEVLTDRQLELSRGLPLTHVFFTRADFFTSLAVEIVFHRCRNNEYSDLPYVCAVLKAATGRKDLFACYIVQEIAHYIHRIDGWVPDYEVLFEGSGELAGLRTCLQSDFEELRRVGWSAIREMSNSEVIEVREMAKIMTETQGEDAK